MFLAYLRFHKLGGDFFAGGHEVHGQVAGAVLDLHILRHQNLLQDLQPGRHLPKHTARLVTLEPPICQTRFCQSCPQTTTQNLPITDHTKSQPEMSISVCLSVSLSLGKNKNKQILGVPHALTRKHVDLLTYTHKRTCGYVDL